MNPNCIYEVKTQWGRIRLDERAYQDYLAGKLWICSPTAQTTRPAQLKPLPSNVGKEALKLREEAERDGVHKLLPDRFHGGNIVIPYKERMKNIRIDEMCLSVRSSNGLMRAGADTFGKLAKQIAGESGLRGVRNLGVKSEKEILSCFLTACYERLSENEKAVFWQELLNRQGMNPDSETAIIPSPCQEYRENEC